MQDYFTSEPEPWRALAACRGVPEDIFFAHAEEESKIVAAKAVCASCPVREECLAYALDLNQTEGIWGGLTPAERRRRRRTRRIAS
jgi:WhiB family redox-sensing transcriptional regulator